MNLRDILISWKIQHFDPKMSKAGQQYWTLRVENRAEKLEILIRELKETYGASRDFFRIKSNYEAIIYTIVFKAGSNKKAIKNAYKATLAEIENTVHFVYSDEITESATVTNADPVYDEVEEVEEDKYDSYKKKLREEAASYGNKKDLDTEEEIERVSPKKDVKRLVDDDFLAQLGATNYNPFGDRDERD